MSSFVAPYTPTRRHRLQSDGGGVRVVYRPHRRERRRQCLPPTSPQTWAVCQAASDGAVPSPQTHLALSRRLQSGDVTVRPLTQEDVADSAVLLTRAFLNSPESLSGRTANPTDRDFCIKALRSPPLAVMLVAQLTPNDAGELGPERRYRIVGVAHVSLSRDSRPEFPAAQPPENAAYISSMAVDVNYRRQGVARLMIEACEELCSSLQIRLLSLHAWSNDTIAQGCYRSCAFEFATPQNRLRFPVWKRVRTRLLMLKEVSL